MDQTDLVKQLRRIGKLIDQKKFKKALPLVETLMTRFPDEPRLWKAQAVCESETGHSKRAVAILRKARVRFPGDRSVLYSLAETLVEAEDFEEAERVYPFSL